MRPRYLEIKGLQSFREAQVIDFDRLSETGLFGIFGPTGSGKSTVLDAVTLALYGEVHRAVSGTQGIINTNENSVKVTFVFDLLKDNVRKTYKVERVYNKKKGSENSCEAKIARLIEVYETGEMPVADKPREVTAKVEELLGLQHSDFTRAVVLPQNKFQEFLLMKNSDKSKMLERIFYLEEYGKLLNEKVSKKLSNTKTRLSGVQGALSQLGDASDKALEDSKKNMESAEVKRDNVVKELKAFEARYNEAKEVWQLVSELNSIIQKEQIHFASQNEINAKKTLLDKLAKAEGIIGYIKKHKETEKVLVDTNVQLDAVLLNLPVLQKQLDEERLKLELLEKQSEEENPRLVEQKTRLNSALEIKNEINDIDSKLNALREGFKTIKEKISVLDKGIENGSAEIKSFEENILICKSQANELKVDIDYRSEIQKGVRLEDELTLAKSSRDTQQESFKILSEKVTQLHNKLNAAIEQVQASKSKLEVLQQEQANHNNSKPGSRDEITTGIEHFHNVKTLYSTMKSKNNDIELIKLKIVKASEALKKSQESLNTANETRINYEGQRKLCLEEVEGLKRIIEQNSAYMMASTLNDGDPCPVCGSMHHHNPATESVHEEIKEVEQKLENSGVRLTEIEAALRDAENRCTTLTEQVKNLEEQYTQLGNTFAESRKEYEELLSKLPEQLRAFSLDQLENELESINQQNENKHKAIVEWEAKIEEIKNKISKVNEELSGLLGDEKGLKSELQVNSENLKQAENALSQAAQIYAEKKTVYDEFLSKYKINNAANELKRISENERQVEVIQQKIEQYQKAVDNARKTIEELQLQRQKLINDLTEVETDGKNLRAQKEEKEKKIRELAGEKDIIQEIKTIEETLVNFVQQEKALAEHVRKLDGEVNELVTQKTTLENQKDIYTKNLTAEKEKLDEELTSRGFLNAGEVEAAIVDAEKQTSLSKEIYEYEQTSRNLQAHRSIVTKNLGNRSITEEQWNETSVLYETKILEKEVSISGYEVAKNTYSVTKERHDQWVVLSRDFNNLSRRADMLDQIKTLLKGNSFIEYIAEERLRYIAKEASETLGIMTKYRYALEMDAENGFIICDNANGGVRRLVSSLSGGETFLTALSLALALSKQIQLKGQSPLEFFFLDEGFGTLDSNLLDTVIDSLERLSTKERVIGLISHVPELRNRIARRLIIEPPVSDGCGSRVRIEKA